MHHIKSKIIFLLNLDPCYTIPASCPVQAQLVPNPALHLPPVELILVLEVIAVTGVVQLATFVAYLDPGRRPEASKVKFKVTSQIAFTGGHIRKDIICIIPAEGVATLRTPKYSGFEMNTIDVFLPLVLALKLLYWIYIL